MVFKKQLIYGAHIMMQTSESGQVGNKSEYIALSLYKVYMNNLPWNPVLEANFVVLRTQ